MTSDTPVRATYSSLMQGEADHVRLTLDNTQPIALSDFIGSFVGIGNQFEKFVATKHPELKAESEFFVKEVRAGSIQADLVSWIANGASVVTLPGIIDVIDKSQIMAKFVADFRDKVTKYFKRGGREPNATKSDLSDFLRAVEATAHDPNGNTTLEAAYFEDGKRKVRAAFKFSTKEARIAEAQIAEHRKELEAKTGVDEARVLLRFVRPSVEAGKPGKKGGERGIIDKVHKRALPILYASDMAEQRLRHELMTVQGNVFRTLFDVDVNVERNSANKPIAYRITAVHGVIDDEGDGED